MTPQENQSSETRVAQPPAVAEGEANGDAALRKGRPPRRANVPHLRRRAEIFLRLREVCKNYSTSELAELTNSHYETVRRHLADKTPPSSSFLEPPSAMFWAFRRNGCCAEEARRIGRVSSRSRVLPCRTRSMR